MNKTALLTGGTVLFAGGMLWYLLKTQKHQNAECVNGDVKCVKDDLYRCINGRWRLEEKNSNQCIQACFGGEDCTIPNYTRCDKFNNLCQCINGKWTCIDTNSYICASGIKHKECFVDTADNYSWCLEVPGEDVDYCWANGPGSEGCSCNPPARCADMLSYPYWCDPTILRCIPARGGQYTYQGEKMPGDRHAGICYTEDITPYKEWAIPGTELLKANVKWENAFPGEIFGIGIAVISWTHHWYTQKTEVAWFGGNGETKWELPLPFSKKSVVAVQVFVGNQDQDVELDWFSVNIA